MRSYLKEYEPFTNKAGHVFDGTLLTKVYTKSYGDLH